MFQITDNELKKYIDSTKYNEIIEELYSQKFEIYCKNMYKQAGYTNDFNKNELEDQIIMLLLFKYYFGIYL